MNDSSKKLQSGSKENLKEFVLGFDEFGTRINLSIVADEGEIEKVSKVFEEARRVYGKFDVIFSRFSKDSEISKLNSSLGVFNEASDEMIEAAKKSILYNKETYGYFDPRITDFLEEAGYKEDFSKMPKAQHETANHIPAIAKPLEEELMVDGARIFFGRKMDFAGIVKGMVNDKVAECFLREGFQDFVVDSGGDMFFSGKNVDGNDWTVDVEGVSWEKMTMEISGKGIATSGITKRKWEKNGERKHHIINPQSPGVFKFDLRTVTVIGSSTEEADVWAKALFLMGREAGMAVSKRKGINCIFFDYSGNVWPSFGVSEYKSNKPINILEKR